jgi:thiol-disulfide isomerase/thioredoxin
MKELIFKNKTAVVILLIVIISSTIYMLWNKSIAVNQELTPNFSISGKIEGAENQRIYIEAPSDRGMIQVADTLISSSGSFKLEGNIPDIGYYLLRVGENQANIIPITLVPKDVLKINCTLDNFPTEPNTSGTEWTSALNDYLKLLKQFQIDQDNLEAKKEEDEDEDVTDEINNQILIIKSKLDSTIKTKMLNDPSNAFNIVISSSLLPSTSFNNWDKDNLKIMKVIANAFELKYPRTNVSQSFRKQVNDLESAYNTFLNSNNGAREAPEISSNNPDGKPLKLSDLRGKIVLIDFWASWCAPCRKENPTIVKLYNKYKNKNFTILSVSLDQDLINWRGAIKIDGLKWPNHVSDLKGWGSAVISSYNFNAIPHTVLVNKEGKIICEDLRGIELEQKIAEIINQ